MLASRANGRRSRGPVTAAGKQRSSQNAVRHGLLARCLVLQDESPEGFRQAHDEHVAQLQPANPLELAIIDEMVAAMWRMRRAWAIETNLMETASSTSDPLQRITDAFKELAATPALSLLHRYETRLHMVYQRALKNLLLLRSLSPAEAAEPIELPPPPSPEPTPPAPEPPAPSLEPDPAPSPRPAAAQPAIFQTNLDVLCFQPQPDSRDTHAPGPEPATSPHPAKPISPHPSTLQAR